MAMPRLRHYVGPDWPFELAGYAYLLNLCRSDLAWEYLRRNPEYQRNYRLFPARCRAAATPRQWPISDAAAAPLTAVRALGPRPFG